MEHINALQEQDAVFPPLGLLTLAALTPAEFHVTLCDENANETVDYATDAEIVGITGYLIHDCHVFAMADRFRKRGKTVVLGGPIANLVPELCRPHCDVLFEGEAEYTWKRFLGDWLRGTPADHYVEHEKIHMPDSPMPQLDLLKRKYAHGIVQCTRGCPFTCEFCDIIVMYGRKMRYKPIAQVLAEIEAWHRHGAPQIFFADDNFVGNRAYAKELLRAIVAWNSRQRRPPSYYTQASIDMVRDDELLCLLRDANFNSVFLGIESPRKASLAETKKTQNERIDLIGAIHKLQSYNLFIYAGMIVGFDQDDASIFDEQYEFLQQAQIPIVMINYLMAVPKTPLYNRLKAEGRLVRGSESDFQDAGYIGTAGNTNFHPRLLTRQQLQRGQERLYKRLYAPDAFAARLLGNLSRFRNVHFRPEPLHLRNVRVLGRLIGQYWGLGPAARRFFWGCLWRALRTSPRLFGQVATLLGMYLHFCRVRAQELSWDPWRRAAAEPPEPGDPIPEAEPTVA
jgi:radical SAM superfamily enzyme YgiQ (UPF0313 family)